MPTAPRTAWRFDRSWGDPMIATLLLLSLLLSSQVLARRRAPTPPSPRISLAGRLAETSLAMPRFLEVRHRSLMKATHWDQAAARLTNPWDQALVAILAAEEGDRTEAKKQAATAPSPLAKALRCAYDGGEPPSPSERSEVREGLSPTRAGRILESRLLDRKDGSGALMRSEALEDLRGRVLTLALLGLLLFTAGLGGLVFALRLFAIRRRPMPGWIPWLLEGRSVALLFLAWNSALLLSGTLAGVLINPLPSSWRILGLPLSYGVHACLGILLLQGFSGTDFPAWKQRFFRLPWGRVLGWAAGFAGLAVLSVFLVGLALAPLLRHSQPAQKELLDALAAARGLPATLLLFFTVAGLAPAFEECFFRGFLLPWMGERWGKAWALLASSLLFGLIHLTPGGMPTLATLGLVFGLAYFRTGDLRVCILVHGAWNGAVFLFTRWVLG